jgi:hypothetical protein
MALYMNPASLDLDPHLPLHLYMYPPSLDLDLIHCIFLSPLPVHILPDMYSLWICGVKLLVILRTYYLLLTIRVSFWLVFLVCCPPMPSLYRATHPLLPSIAHHDIGRIVSPTSALAWGRFF